MRQYTPTTQASPSLTKEQWRCIKMNSLPQWDLIHQLLHHTEDSIGHCTPWADSPFKGTGWTYRVFSAIFYILKQQFVFFYKDKLVLTYLEFHLDKVKSKSKPAKIRCQILHHVGIQKGLFSLCEQRMM